MYLGYTTLMINVEVAPLSSHIRKVGELRICDMIFLLFEIGAAHINCSSCNCDEILNISYKQILSNNCFVTHKTGNKWLENRKVRVLLTSFVWLWYFSPIRQHLQYRTSTIGHIKLSTTHSHLTTLKLKPWINVCIKFPSL